MSNLDSPLRAKIEENMKKPQRYTLERARKSTDLQKSQKKDIPKSIVSNLTKDSKSNDKLEQIRSPTLSQVKQNQKTKPEELIAEEEIIKDITLWMLIENIFSMLWSLVENFSVGKIRTVFISIFSFFFSGIIKKCRCGFCSKFTGTVIFACFLGICCLGFVLDVARQQIPEIEKHL